MSVVSSMFPAPVASELKLGASGTAMSLRKLFLPASAPVSPKIGTLERGRRLDSLESAAKSLPGPEPDWKTQGVLPAKGLSLCVRAVGEHSRTKKQVQTLSAFSTVLREGVHTSGTGWAWQDYSFC